MNLKTLSSQAMLSNSQEWLNNPELRRALEAHTLGSGILAEIQTAHGELSDAVSQRKRLTQTVAHMTAELEELDAMHDRMARGLSKLLDGLIEVVDEEETVEAFAGARRLLFPDDLRITTRSYSEEHGAIVEMEARVTPEVLALLSQTRIGENTLAAIYDQWRAAGKELGELTKRRARAQAAIKRSGAAPPVIDTSGARLGWIRTAQVFVSIIELLPLDDEQRTALLAPLERDIARALQSRTRAAGRGSNGAGDGIDSGAGAGDDIDSGDGAVNGDERDDFDDTLDPVLAGDGDVAAS